MSEECQCYVCHKITTTDDVDAAELIETGEYVLVCHECVEEENFDQRSLDLFDI